MSEEIQDLRYLATHAPLVLVGLTLIGTSVVLSAHVQLRMLELGDSSIRFFGLPRRFDWRPYVNCLKIRKQEGRSGWPVYLMVAALTAGVASLVTGLRLM